MKDKKRINSVYEVSEEDFNLILQATEQAEILEEDIMENKKFSESPLPKEYIEWLSKQKGVDNRGVKGESCFFDDSHIDSETKERLNKEVEEKRTNGSPLQKGLRYDNDIADMFDFGKKYN